MVVAVANPALVPAAVSMMREALMRALKLDLVAPAAPSALQSAGPSRLRNGASHKPVLPAPTMGGRSGAVVETTGHALLDSTSGDARGLAAQVLASRLRQLSRADSVVLSLRYEQSLTWAEVSVATGWSVSRVRRMHHRALGRLQAELLAETVRSLEGTDGTAIPEAAG